MAALTYCEICGVLLSGSGQGRPEGVICDGCFASRQVMVGSDSDVSGGAPAAQDEKVQFECVYCRSLLRLAVVGQRTNVRCPQCSESFFLCPDGRVEARLQGDTTAILAKDAGLRELSGHAPDGPATRPLRGHEKTQPISPVSDTQKAALRDLTAKNLDMVQALPPRPLLPVDQRRSRTRREAEPEDGESEELELLPPDVGPGEADTAVQLHPYAAAPEDLRASDEGRIDLDVERLRRRTQTRRLRDRGKALTERRKRAEEDAGQVSERQERRQRRQAEAARRTNELERSKAQRSLRGSLLASAVIFPALLGLLLLSMTVRGAGFASRGQVGQGLERLGDRAAAGLRRLNALLPEGVRQPLPGGR